MEASMKVVDYISKPCFHGSNFHGSTIVQAAMEVVEASMESFGFPRKLPWERWKLPCTQLLEYSKKAFEASTDASMEVPMTASVDFFHRNDGMFRRCSGICHGSSGSFHGSNISFHGRNGSFHGSKGSFHASSGKSHRSNGSKLPLFSWKLPVLQRIYFMEPSMKVIYPTFKSCSHGSSFHGNIIGEAAMEAVEASMQAMYMENSVETVEASVEVADASKEVVEAPMEVLEVSMEVVKSSIEVMEPSMEEVEASVELP